VACQIISSYWQEHVEGEHTGAAAAVGASSTTSTAITQEQTELFCFLCALQETLWVCLTCGFVGCGRYSNKHAAHHFQETGHPYSLELATLRIWDYVDGEFAHRIDLLECPASPPRLHPWLRRPSSSSSRRLQQQHGSSSIAAASSSSSTDAFGTTLSTHQQQEQFPGYAASETMAPHIDEKSPKKATMIGEEYEALLQSALEEQAQHFEGEITRLRATLTAEQVDASTMTLDERNEIDKLQADIQKLRAQIDLVGSHLLAAQAQEAGHRATSQRLLREQQITQDLIQTIRQENTREHEEGRLQLEELEQQIADLTANQRMRQQFSSDQELQNAQIFGTTAAESKNRKKQGGKKFRRSFRK